MPLTPFFFVLENILTKQFQWESNHRFLVTKLVVTRIKKLHWQFGLGLWSFQWHSIIEIKHLQQNENGLVYKLPKKHIPKKPQPSSYSPRDFWFLDKI
jgi:hypothetical protein